MARIDYFTQALTYKTAADMRARWETLPEPQQQVALLVIEENLTNLQIAGRLGLSLHTVKQHLTEVYDSLGVANRRSLRLAMLFTKYVYELLESFPALSGEGKETPPPPA